MHSIALSYIYKLFVSSCFIVFLDKLIKLTSTKSPWFDLHCIINYLIVFFSFNDVYLCFKNPNNSMLLMDENTITASSLCFCLHLYHTLCYELKPMDIFHHYLFIFIATPLYLIYSYKGSALIFFFSSGLPGGIDYLLLSLVKNNKINFMIEKKINGYLNSYIRMPGGFITSYIIFKDGIYFADMRMYNNIMLSGLIFYNSAYFGKLAIENYIERKMLCDKKDVMCIN